MELTYNFDIKQMQHVITFGTCLQRYTKYFNILISSNINLGVVFMLNNRIAAKFSIDITTFSFNGFFIDRLGVRLHVE